MNIKDQIRAEIERLERHYLIRDGYDCGWNNALDAISKFIDSLPEQSVDGLEEAFEKEYAKFSIDPDAGNYAFPIDLSDYKDFARHFAEWGAKHLKK